MHSKTQICRISLVFSDAEVRYNCTEVVIHNATKSICLPGIQMTSSSEWKQQTAVEIKLLNKVSVKANKDVRHRTILKAQNILVG